MEGVSKSPRIRPRRGAAGRREAPAFGTAQPVAVVLPCAACAAWEVRLRKSAGLTAPGATAGVAWGVCVQNDTTLGAVLHERTAARGG